MLRDGSLDEVSMAGFPEEVTLEQTPEFQRVLAMQIHWSENSRFSSLRWSVLSMFKGHRGSQIMSHKDRHILIPRTYEYVRLHSKGTSIMWLS